MTDRLSQLLELLQHHDDDSFLLFAVAKEYEKCNALQEALQYYQKVVATNPAYVGVYYHLGKLYEALGNADMAIKTYQEGIEQATRAGDHHARAELSAALMELDQ